MPLCTYYLDYEVEKLQYLKNKDKYKAYDPPYSL